MSKLSLAATGWVAQKPTGSGYEPDHPIGNRLRWSWPEDAAQGGHRILPDRILVERAPIDIDVDAELVMLYGPAAAVPLNLWQQHGDIDPQGHTPVQLSIDEVAGGPVQAVGFTYESFGGTEALMQAFDGDRCVATRWVQDGELVALHAPSIDRLTIMTPHCVLRGLSTLDLYAPTQLDFDVVAKIELSATAGAAFGEVVSRYPATPTIHASQWAELQDAWSDAWAEAPGIVGPNGGPNAWDALQIALATRWEYAVLCGLGFVDGPDTGKPSIDSWHDLLKGPDGVAYRVRDSSEKLAPSNVVYVPGIPAPDLEMLPAPTIEDGSVRLGSSGKIRASWAVAWASPTPGIVGVEIEETLTVDGNPTTDIYDGRGRRETDPPGAGFVHRVEDVESHEVTVRARVRPEDGFDRVGLWGPVSPNTKMAIDHHPQPPLFRTAANNGSSTTLTQQSAWEPDKIVESAIGRVHFFRRFKDPIRHSAKVLEVIPIDDGLLVRLDGPAPSKPAMFMGGQITIATLRGEMLLVGWPWVAVEVPHGDGPIVSVSTGDIAVLAQSPTYPALFTQVHNEQADGLKQKVTFPDQVSDPTRAQLLEYRARVEFAGQKGPFGPAVQALWLPATPDVPPPFKITTLGVDFYDRTVVQLELTEQSDAMLEVWWADGAFPADGDKPNDEFPRKATPGDAGVRQAESGKILFDTMSLPVPDQVPRTVTIGIQAVNSADGRSAFETVVHTLPAA